ncbi:MAG: hypothetical protein IJH12_10785 [Clostridia bacterium]|nr:hypothetical protein [Clostridia bacterium]
MNINTEFTEKTVNNKQIDMVAYALHKDIGCYVDTNSEEYKNWLLYEIITDALNEKGSKLQNEITI